MAGRERGFPSSRSPIPGLVDWTEEDRDVRFSGGSGGSGSRSFGLSAPESQRDLQRERQHFSSSSSSFSAATPPYTRTSPSPANNMSTPLGDLPSRISPGTAASSSSSSSPSDNNKGPHSSNASAAPPPRKAPVPLKPAGSSLSFGAKRDSGSRSGEGDTTMTYGREEEVGGGGGGMDGSRAARPGRRFGADTSMLSSSSLRLGDAMPTATRLQPPPPRRPVEEKKTYSSSASPGTGSGSGSGGGGMISRGLNQVRNGVANAFESLRFRNNKSPPAAPIITPASASGGARAGPRPDGLSTTTTTNSILGLRSSARRPRRREGCDRDAPIVLLGSDDEDDDEEEEDGDDRIAIVDKAEDLANTSASTTPQSLSSSHYGNVAYNFRDSDIVKLMSEGEGGLMSSERGTATYEFGAVGVHVPVWEAYIPLTGQTFVTAPIKGHADVKSCSEIVLKRPIRSMELRLFHSMDKACSLKTDFDSTIHDISDVFCRKETLIYSFDSIVSIRCGSLIDSSAGGQVTGDDTRFAVVDVRTTPEAEGETFGGQSDLIQIFTVFDESSFKRFSKEISSTSDLSGKLEFVNNLDDVASLRSARAVAGISTVSASDAMAPPIAVTSIADRIRSKRRRSGEGLVQDLTNTPGASAASAPDRVLFVFPMERKALDVITIMSCDRDRLMHSDCLNDNLIDLRLRLLLSGTSASEYASEVRKGSCNAKVTNTSTVASSSVHAFSCHFYSLLSKRGANRDTRTITAMCKNVDIFNLDFLFIPIHQAGHWSLACAVRPGILARQHNKDLSQSFTDDSENSCCLLHLDSLSLHSTNAVLTNVATFLSEEFARRAALTPATENSPSTPQSTDRKLGGQGRVFNRTNCPFVKCKQVCQQENGVDCGVFVIKYVEMILSASPTSTPEDIRTEFHDYFQPLMFSQTDADVERIKFISDIDALSQCWTELCQRREAMRRERAVKGPPAKRAAGGASSPVPMLPSGRGDNLDDDSESDDADSSAEVEGLMQSEAVEDVSASRERGSGTSNLKAALAGLIGRKASVN